MHDDKTRSAYRHRSKAAGAHHLAARGAVAEHLDGYNLALAVHVERASPDDAKRPAANLAANLDVGDIEAQVVHVQPFLLHEEGKVLAQGGLCSEVEVPVVGPQELNAAAVTALVDELPAHARAPRSRGGGVAADLFVCAPLLPARPRHELGEGDARRGIRFPTPQHGRVCVVGALDRGLQSEPALHLHPNLCAGGT